MFYYPKPHISIYKNTIIEGGTIRAFYMLKPYNYDIMTEEVVERQIRNIYNAFERLRTNRGKYQASIIQLSTQIRRGVIINKLIEWIKQYDPSYVGMPAKYAQYITCKTTDIPILMIRLVNHEQDITNMNPKQIAQYGLDQIKYIFSTDSAPLDYVSIDQQLKNVYNILHDYVDIMDRTTLTTLYIKRLYPSYNIILNPKIIEHANSVINNLTQEITPHLTWFEMSNSGIENLGAKAETTYGSMLTILKFPDTVNTKYFNLYQPGLSVNMDIPTALNIELMFKRKRSQIYEEFSEATSTDESDTDIGAAAAMVRHAIIDVKQNKRVMANLDCNILVTAKDYDTLEQRKKDIISNLQDSNIIASFAPKQAKTFIQSYNRFIPLNYPHVVDLEYVMSFKCNNGTIVGDGDSKYTAPIIGQDQRNVDIQYSPFTSIFENHTGGTLIIGQPGSGKTFFLQNQLFNCKVMNQRFFALDFKNDLKDLLTIDPSIQFVDIPNGEKGGLNIFSLVKNINTNLVLSIIYIICGTLTPTQKTAITPVVQDFVKEYNAMRRDDTDVCLKDVADELFAEDNKDAQNVGSAINRNIDSPYGDLLLKPADTAGDILNLNNNHSKIISFHGMKLPQPGETLNDETQFNSAIIYIVCVLLRQLMTAGGYPTLFAMDEAHIAYQNPQFADIIQNMLALGRSLNVATTLASQSIHHYPPDIAQYISNAFCFRSAISDSVEFLNRLYTSTADNALDIDTISKTIPDFKPGECFMIDRFHRGGKIHISSLLGNSITSNPFLRKR